MGTSNAITAVLLASLVLQSAQPHSADALQEAESLLQKQQYDQAEVKLQGLVKTQSSNPQAWFDLGFAESHLDKNAEAIAAYRKAIELSPKWFEANHNLGLTLAKAGNPADPNIIIQSLLQHSVMISDMPPTPVTGGIILKSTTNAMIVVNDSGIYLDNGKGASIMMVGPNITINKGALVVI